MPRPTSYQYPDWLFSQDQIRAIGAVAFQSAYLERVLDDFIMYALDTDEDGLKIFTKGKFLDAKMDFLFAVLAPKLKNLAHKTTLRAIYDSVKPAITDRNMIIHGEWMDGFKAWTKGYAKTYPSASMTVRLPRNGKQPKILKATEIEKVAFKLWDVCDRLLELRDKNPLRHRASKR